MYHFKKKQSKPAATKAIPHVSAIGYPRSSLAGSSLPNGQQQVTQNDKEAADSFKMIGKSSSMTKLVEQRDDDCLDFERSSSLNSFFRRRKHSADEQRQESSRELALKLCSQYELDDDKDETLNKEKGNFKKSETITKTPTLSTMITVKQAQALISEQQRDNEARTPAKNECLFEPTSSTSNDIIKNMHTHNPQDNVSTIVDGGVLLENFVPDEILMDQVKRRSYGMMKRSSSSPSMQHVEKALLARRALNSSNNNNSNMVEPSVGFDDHYSMTSTTNKDAASMQTRMGISPMIQQLPELC